MQGQIGSGPHSEAARSWRQVLLAKPNRLGSDSQSLYFQDKTEEQQSDACQSTPKCFNDIQLHPTLEDESRQQSIHWNRRSLVLHC